jgi:hypothetical protein
MVEQPGKDDSELTGLKRSQKSGAGGAGRAVQEGFCGGGK